MSSFNFICFVVLALETVFAWSTSLPCDLPAACSLTTFNKREDSTSSGTLSPTPSSYPGEDAALNEFKYLNFDPMRAGSNVSIPKTHKAFKDWRKLVLAGLGSAVMRNTVFLRYFPEDKSEVVQDVFRQMIVQHGMADAQSRISNLVVDADISPETYARCYGDADDGRIIGAYLESTHIHLCYNQTRASLDEITCEHLDNVVSDKMTSTASQILHAIVHWDQISLTRQAPLNTAHILLNN